VDLKNKYSRLVHIGLENVFTLAFSG